MSSAMSSAPWLFVNGAQMFGGHEVMLLRWLDELKSQARIEPKLLARRNTRLRERAAEFGTATDLAPTRRVPRLFAPVASALRLCRDAITFIRVARTVRPSLCIVTEGCLLAQPVFTATARLIGIRVVVYTPLVDPSVEMGFQRGALRDWLVKRVYGNMPHGWITITRQQARVLAAWASIERPILTLPNVVDRMLETNPSNYLVAFPQASLTRSTLQQRVLVMGRLDAFQKGLDLLLDFLERAPVGLPFHVSIVGDGDYRQEIERRLASSPPLGRTITLSPWADTATTMRQHDVLLLPSRFEGVPLVMLEAMALGLPVVASDLPGTRTYLAAENLFEVGDLAGAFARIAHLRDPEVREATVMRNRQAFEAGASTKAFSRSVRELTDELLQLAGAA